MNRVSLFGRIRNSTTCKYSEALMERGTIIHQYVSEMRCYAM